MDRFLKAHKVSAIAFASGMLQGKKITQMCKERVP